MLLPREEIYRERTFDELMKDEFTREIFNVISQNEDNLEWRFYPSEVTAEEQYAELFNMTYYFLAEAQMRPYPQLRIGEYEIYIEERANVYSYDSPLCKDYIFSIMYYLENEHFLINDSAFCERLKLRADEYFYNSFFRSMPIEKVWNWFSFMIFPVDESEKKILIDKVERNRNSSQISAKEISIKKELVDKNIENVSGVVHEECVTKEVKSRKVYDFRQCITFPEDAEHILKRFHELIDIQTSPKQIIMPLRAAFNAGVINKPTWGEFCAEFGSDKVKSKTSLSTYLAKSYKFTDEAFNLLVKEFVEYRNRS